MLLISIGVGCGDGLNRKAVFPVTGRILVDGEPVDQLAIKCFSTGGIDKEDPTISSTFTDAQGNFKISTYEEGDGVPEGEYILTVRWGQLNAFSMSYDGDKFDGKYDQENSNIKFTVTAGQPTDLGEIELTTK
jgi:hypothetical protein